MAGPLDLQKGILPSDGQGDPTVFPGSAPPTPSLVAILLDLLSSVLSSEVDMGNEGAYSSRLGIDFQAVSYEQTDTLWSQQPTLQHQHEDQLSEQERGLLQWSVGVGSPLSQHPLDIPAGTSGDANNALSALTPQIHEGQLFEREHYPLLQKSIEVSNPPSQHHSDLPTSTSGDVNYALGALTPQNYTSYEKQTLYQQPRPLGHGTAILKYSTASGSIVYICDIGDVELFNMPCRARAVLGSSLSADSEYTILYIQSRSSFESVRRLALNPSDSEDSVSAHSCLDSNSSVCLHAS
ncbi:hypothetical protein M405DRAFT_931191 [Rhizopogon salebrosus TDB-379]|nr:hypothetical protein M405DRAFT_931191 [Rhizopogon salebrosus TDB-379]